MNGRDETPSKPASELEGLIRDKLPDPVRRHLIDVITDRTDVDGLGPNWTAQPVWSHDVSNNDKESSSAMFQTAPMRTLPVIFCLTCFFFPAIASAQLAPGWVSEVLNVGALP